MALKESGDLKIKVTGYSCVRRAKCIYLISLAKNLMNQVAHTLRLMATDTPNTALKESEDLRIKGH